jgi:hypothetical protein
MKLFPISISAALFIGQVRAKKLSQPSVEIVVDPSSNNLGIDIHIEFAAPQSDLNSTAGYIKSNASVVPYNRTAFNQTIAYATSYHDGHTTIHQTPTSPLVVTTQGFFPNSTSFPTSTVRFQSPSLMDLTAFSGSTSVERASGFLIAIAVVSLVGV